jgi:hypothetical protein
MQRILCQVRAWKEMHVNYSHSLLTYLLSVQQVYSNLQMLFIT